MKETPKLLIFPIHDGTFKINLTHLAAVLAAKTEQKLK